MMYGEDGETVLSCSDAARGDVIESAIREMCSGGENGILAFTIEACDQRPSPYSTGKMIAALSSWLMRSRRTSALSAVKTGS